MLQISDNIESILGRLDAAFLKAFLLPSSLYLFAAWMFTGLIYKSIHIDLPHLIFFAISSAVISLLLIPVSRAVLKALLYNSWIKRIAIRITNRHQFQLADKEYAELRQLREVLAQVTHEADSELEIESIRLQISNLHNRLNAQNPNAELFPVDFAVPIFGTKLLNIFAYAYEYCYSRYGINLQTVYPRLLGVVPKDNVLAENSASEQQQFIIALIYFTLSITYGLALTIIGLIYSFGDWKFYLILAVIAFIALLISYSQLLKSSQKLAQTLITIIDLYRHSLLENLGIVPPTILTEEKRIWLDLDRFFSQGDDFFWPNT